MENKLEEGKQKLSNIALEMLLEDKKIKKLIKKSGETLTCVDIEWKHYESYYCKGYGDMFCAVFIMYTNKGLFLFKVGGDNVSYKPL